METNPEPTPAQAEAGNYRKGKIQLNGFDIAIENPKGSTRRGTDPEGRPWESSMAHHYGDIKGTKAADGDNLDVFIGDNPGSQRAYIIDQINADGTYDEAKIMLGFDSLEQARQGYLANYDEGWNGLGSINEMSVDELKTWTREGATDKPYGDIQAQPKPVETGREQSPVDEIATGMQVVHNGQPHTIADVITHPTAGRRLVSFEDAPNNYVFEDDVSPAATPEESQQAAAAEAAPEPAAQPAPTLKPDGKPFQTRRAAELSKRFRETPNATPVEVEGGWGFTTSMNTELDAAQPAGQQSASQGVAMDNAPEPSQSSPKPEETQPTQAQGEPAAPAPSAPRPASKPTKSRKPATLTPRQQRVSDAFGGATIGDTINLLTDVGYSKAGNAYTIDSINKDGTLQATNVERGSSVLISQGEWTSASRRTKAPIAEVVKPSTSETAASQTDANAPVSDEMSSSASAETESSQQPEDQRYSVSQGDSRLVNRKDIEEALAGSPELADVTVIQSTTDLPTQSLLMMAMQGVNPKDVRGLYVGDKLYVIADNVDSVQDGIKTAIHEAVGHKGIRGVLGEELKPVMRQVYRTLPMDKRGREALNEVLESYPFLDQSNPEHQLTIAEEMIAHLTEKGWSPSPVKRAVAKVRELLRRLFPKMKWTDADVMALSRQSRKWLSDQQVSAQGGTDADIRFSMSTPPGGNFDPNDSTNFSLPDESLKQAALRKMADKMNRLKITQDAIKKAGGNINEDNDVYLAEELFHGKTERDLNELSRNYVEKLAKQMAIRGIQQEELDAYLYARHAPERNARIAERNPNDSKYADGGSGMTNAEAAAIMQEAETSGKRLRLERLAAIVDDMLAHRREIIREGGLESNETLDAWDASYDYYVPLKGWANDEDIPVGQDGSGRMRSGRGYEISGRETKTALGRLSKAASPSTQAIVDTTESVIRKRKNEVGNALLSLITDNPNPALWQVFTNSNPDTQRTKVEKVDPDTGEKRIEVVDRPVAMEMNERYFKTKKAGRTFYIKINDQRLLNAMRNVGPEQNNMLVRTAAAGTRALSAMMTSYSPEFMTTNFARDIQTALLNIAAEQTRDDGKIKGKKMARQTARDVPRAMKAAYRGLTSPGAQRNTEWDRWFDEFIEDGAKTGYFDMKDLAGQAKEIKSIMGRANGGTLGNMLKTKKAVADFVENMNGSVENAVRLSAYVNARRSGISRKKAASLAKNLTVNFNRRGEAGTALNAAYMFANASIQGTMNVARTMITVKDTPVGGNRMNIWGRMNLAQKSAVGMAIGSYALAMFNRMMSDEDDDGELFYDKIPSHVKERNLIIMTSGKDYVRIPLPYGYNVFSNIGTYAESVMAGKSSLTEASKNMTLAILGSFSPIGFQDSEDTSNLVMKNLTPTLLGSVTQVAVNEDFAGRVIFKENFPFGTPKPDSALAFRSTPSAYQDFAQYINKLTRGSEYRSGGVDVSPDVLQHVVNYYGGGAWSFTEKVADSIKRTATGETIDPHRIPFVGRFRSEVNEYGDIQTFYERRTEVGQLHEEFINLPREEARSFYDEHGGKIGLFDMAKDLEGTLTDLRKVRDAIEADDRLTTEERDEQLDEIEEAMDSEVDFFNLLYNQAEGTTQSEK
nr:LPD38 domain-containing protein [Halomonas sp. ISL-56]